MAEMYDIWCYIEGDETCFSVSISRTPPVSVSDLQLQIRAENPNFLEGYDAKDLNLIKVRHIMISTRASME
jgi:hypothetical protein